MLSAGADIGISGGGGGGFPKKLFEKICRLFFSSTKLIL